MTVKETWQKAKKLNKEQQGYLDMLCGTITKNQLPVRFLNGNYIFPFINGEGTARRCVALLHIREGHAEAQTDEGYIQAGARVELGGGDGPVLITPDIQIAMKHVESQLFGKIVVPAELSLYVPPQNECRSVVMVKSSHDYKTEADVYAWAVKYHENIEVVIL